MSQLIDLELTRQPRFSINGLGLLMLVASLLGLGFVWQQYQTLEARSDNVLQTLINKSSVKAEKIQSASETIPAIEIKQITTIVDSLITPWQSLLLAIEQADMPDIALLSIEPNIKKQQVLLIGEAKNLQTVLRYIEQLEAQPVLHEVYLLKHLVEETDISKPVTFNVLAKWKMSE